MKTPKPTLWSRLPWHPTLSEQWWKPSRKWALPSAVAGATILTVGALTTSSLVLIDQRSHHRDAMQEVDVLGYVKAFMAGFTTLDPFHANVYYDRVMANATGDFAKQYHDKHNEILVQIAQAEPTKGTTLAAGVERWNDDGTVNVMVATDISMKSPDGKQKVENTNRWVVTAQREGKQWKISSLQQVI
ncbi:mammalian cell entry protein [Mycobacterium paraterrae]|uniref:Mammalian cell entry protein n=1 Tax=Mycobacterium paraterrae TaxID=577492 RepID=A0ABY3VRI8_9MYCO|nr:mammalian cell entry protein [Mycobacterium paraterrae]